MKTIDNIIIDLENINDSIIKAIKNKELNGNDLSEIVHILININKNIIELL